ncbi:hypothetical protein G5714_021048 [Onychostoma macrolepis]|uniref:Uncharacterized protein n=1 Tax=Onychostoma macrolepis TaxID=369639 RepID=A0A7J6BVM1_9TELE|nr:hypothetical protein G5714_021048 [Onychostoma macrolepis]
MNDRTSVEHHRLQESRNDEQRGRETEEKQSKRRVRRSSINKDTPDFSHDSDRPAEIQFNDSQRDAHG